MHGNIINVLFKLFIILRKTNKGKSIVKSSLVYKYRILNLILINQIKDQV